MSDTGERPKLVFRVGDEVVWSSVNHRGVKRYRVRQVGRSLVYIDGDRAPYRMSDGARHDRYGHERISPLDVWAWDESVGAARNYFAKKGFDGTWRVDDAWITHAATLLREDEERRAAEREERGKEKGNG